MICSICKGTKWLRIFDVNARWEYQIVYRLPCPTHKQTKRINENYHKNHLKVVLWPSARQKFTILCIFNHFRRQIDVNWRQYVCYRNKYSSDTLTDCRNQYKPLWKPLKSGIVAIYMTKIDDFAYFRSFSVIFDVKLTSINFNMCAIVINIHLTH